MNSCLNHSSKQNEKCALREDGIKNIKLTIVKLGLELVESFPTSTLFSFSLLPLQKTVWEIFKLYDKLF